MSPPKPTSKRPSRHISDAVKTLLYVHSGGFCEFDGCRCFLFEHSVTESLGNFGEKAHIYAFSENGPRGSDSGRPQGMETNGIENLMLLCGACHTLVDDRKTGEQAYPVEKLKRFKREHEDRVRLLLSIPKDCHSIPFVIRAMIGGRQTEVPDAEMRDAALPGYVRLGERVELNLSDLPDQATDAYWKTGVSAINRKVAQLYERVVSPGKSHRVSVFGLGPIPLLVHLGSKLTDKISVDLYQRHRTPETWTWKPGPGTARYSLHRVQRGEEAAPVALLVNLSGRNDVLDVASILGRQDVTTYELTLDGQDPTPLFLNAKADLERFTEAYLRATARIREAHKNPSEIHLFPAVPAPVAITLGRSRLPKIDPTLIVYDRDKRSGGFVRTLDIP